MFKDKSTHVVRPDNDCNEFQWVQSTGKIPQRVATTSDNCRE